MADEAGPITLQISDFEQVTVRIYKIDHRALLWRQAEDVNDGKRKPSFAELIHLAVRRLEQKP